MKTKKFEIRNWFGDSGYVRITEFKTCDMMIVSKEDLQDLFFILGRFIDNSELGGDTDIDPSEETK